MEGLQFFILGIVFFLVFSLAILLIIVGRLREIYAVTWFVAILSIPGSVFLFPLIRRFIAPLGLESPLEFSFIVCFVVLFVITFHFSSMISSLQLVLKNTVQELTLLEHKVRSMSERKANGTETA